MEIKIQIFGSTCTGKTTIGELIKNTLESKGIICKMIDEPDGLREFDLERTERCLKRIVEKNMSVLIETIQVVKNNAS